MSELDDTSAIAARLDEAARTATAVPQLDGSLSLRAAYEVQRELVQCRIRRGARRAGVKMGFTSRSKMIQMGVDAVIWGRLTEDMRLTDGGTVDRRAFVHPRIEPELAFLVGREVSGEPSLADAQRAIEAVAPAAELIDSRYRDFKFSLTDVVADNSSSAGFILGDWHSAGTDISNLGMILSADGELRESGSSAAILGNPWRSVREAFRLAADAGEPLLPGEIVLAGSPTAAIPLAGTRRIRVDVERLGRLDLLVED